MFSLWKKFCKEKMAIRSKAVTSTLRLTGVQEMRFSVPVFVLKGDHFVFRESKSKGVGKIMEVH